MTLPVAEVNHFCYVYQEEMREALGLRLRPARLRNVSQSGRNSVIFSSLIRACRGNVRNYLMLRLLYSSRDAKVQKLNVWSLRKIEGGRLVHDATPAEYEYVSCNIQSEFEVLLNKKNGLAFPFQFRQDLDDLLHH
jgi:hypothetical protein